VVTEVCHVTLLGLIIYKGTEVADGEAIRPRYLVKRQIDAAFERHDLPHGIDVAVYWNTWGALEVL
jgi:hypothetical protein